MMSNSGKDGRSNDLERPPPRELVLQTYGVDNLELVFGALVLEGLVEGVLDRGVVRLCEMVLRELDRHGRLAWPNRLHTKQMIRRDQEQIHRLHSGTAYRHEEGGLLLIHHNRHLRVEVQPSAEIKRGVE